MDEATDRRRRSLSLRRFRPSLRDILDCKEQLFMGYNGNNRKLKSDMFPKRSISKKDLGLILSPLLGLLLISSKVKENISKEEISDASVTSLGEVIVCSIISSIILAPGVLLAIFSYSTFWTVFGVILTIIFFPLWIFLVIDFVDDYKANKKSSHSKY